MTAICYFRSSNSCSLELLTSVHWFTGPPRSQGSVRSEVWHLCLAPAAFSIFSAASCNTDWKLEKNIVLVYNGIRERESHRVAEFVTTLQLPHSPSRAEHLFLCCEGINKLLMWFTVWDHWSIFVVERPWELGCKDQEKKKIHSLEQQISLLSLQPPHLSFPFFLIYVALFCLFLQSEVRAF